VPSPKASTDIDLSELVPDVPPVSSVQVTDQFADLEIGLEVLELLEVVPVLEHHDRAAVLDRPDDEVQVAPALGPLIQGIKTEEMADDLLEARLWVVEPETDPVARVDVHPVQELVIEDARLLEDAALLVDIVFLLGHGAGRERHRPS